MLSAARPRPVRDDGEDDDDDQKSDPAHAHQARVSDRSRFLRFDPRDGGNSGYEDSEAEPYEPVHDGYWLQDMGQSGSAVHSTSGSFDP
jgi:hypothetical protein